MVFRRNVAVDDAPGLVFILLIISLSTLFFVFLRKSFLFLSIPGLFSHNKGKSPAK